MKFWTQPDRGWDSLWRKPKRYPKIPVLCSLHKSKTSIIAAESQAVVIIAREDATCGGGTSDDGDFVGDPPAALDHGFLSSAT